MDEKKLLRKIYWLEICWVLRLYIVYILDFMFLFILMLIPKKYYNKSLDDYVDKIEKIFLNDDDLIKLRGIW